MRLASGLRASSPMLVSASTSTSFCELSKRNHKSPELYSDICAVGPLFATELTWIHNLFSLAYHAGLRIQDHLPASDHCWPSAVIGCRRRCGDVDFCGRLDVR